MTIIINYHHNIMFIIYVQDQFRNSKWFIHNMSYYYPKYRVIVLHIIIVLHVVIAVAGVGRGLSPRVAERRDYDRKSWPGKSQSVRSLQLTENLNVLPPTQHPPPYGVSGPHAAAAAMGREKPSTPPPLLIGLNETY